MLLKAAKECELRFRSGKTHDSSKEKEEPNQILQE